MPPRKLPEVTQLIKGKPESETRLAGCREWRSAPRPPNPALPGLTYQVLSVGVGQSKGMETEKEPERYGEEEGTGEKRW